MSGTPDVLTRYLIAAMIVMFADRRYSRSLRQARHAALLRHPRIARIPDRAARPRRMPRAANASRWRRRRGAPRRSACAATAAATDEVAITYGGHSTYYIDTPGGIRIATDWNGGYRMGRLPDVVTMNRAHSTHYTLFPDPKIPHVLHGWGEDGAAGENLREDRRRLHPQCHDRYPPLLRRLFRRQHDQGRQLDLHLRGRRPLHRPSRPSASSSSTTAISPRSAGSTS